MFTGIIRCLGTISAVERVEHGRTWWVETGDWDHRPDDGGSVAVNGCCLTVVRSEAGASGGRRLRFDVIPQTLRCTALDDLDLGDGVNLEAPVTPSTLLSGHIVQGHIDGVGEVTDVDTAGGEWRVTVRPPAELMPYIVEKGSIAVDGVSLTVAALEADRFTVALIPTTLEETTFDRLKPGSRVNLETDYVVKALVSYLERSDAAPLR